MDDIQIRFTNNNTRLVPRHRPITDPQLLRDVPTPITDMLIRHLVKPVQFKYVCIFFTASHHGRLVSHTPPVGVSHTTTAGWCLVGVSYNTRAGWYLLGVFDTTTTGCGLAEVSYTNTAVCDLVGVAYATEAGSGLVGASHITTASCALVGISNTTTAGSGLPRFSPS